MIRRYTNFFFVMGVKMLSSILGFNWGGIILVILTLLFIASDKAFSKKVRV